jgi:Leucine-rich repeat (LRR) protein
LTSLDLSSNQIRDISFLQTLTNLTLLYLSSNQITDYSFLQSLTNLTLLNLGNNQIRDISLENFEQLTKLNMMNNPLQSILLKNLTKIEDIDLHGLELIKVKFQGLSNLTNLQLGTNYISDISFLQGLTQLINLDLHRNKISNIPLLLGLTNLTNLDLSSNQITNIPLSFLRSLPKLEDLKLYRNPIQNIPQEIFDIGDENVLEGVRTFLEDLESQEGVANKEIKIIFIGNGSVGKTQVAKRLCEQGNFVFNTEHDSTHGIALLRRDLAVFELNCWDFAGQDLYHATHRLFLQTRALFILVWDFESENRDSHPWKGKKYENEKLEYWLEYAKCFAPESPVLVLQNKIDTFPDDLYFEYKEQLKKDYPILSFLQVSAKTGEGFTVLERVMKKVFQEQATFQTPPLPTNWVEVRKVIREKQEKSVQKTLSIAEFEAMCAENSCEKSASVILDYLHDTGVLYYRKDYFNDQIILNQDWAIQAIYKVLNRESAYFEILKHEKGRLDYELICEIWDENTDDERELFMDFMLSAELAFETTEKGKYKFGERTFAVPQLLPLEKPNDIKSWEQKNAPYLQKTEISYRFLPKVFIQRFMVKANRFSEVRLMWQKGLLLKTQEGSAVVEASYEKGQQKITISVLPNLSDTFEVSDKYVNLTNTSKVSDNYLIQKIREELAKIADEGKLRGREGTSENPEEKFGLAGLNPIAETNKAVYLKTLYNLLNQKLNDEDLTLFCQLHFEEVHNNFSSGQSKTTKISALLDYAKRNDLLESLEKELKEFPNH